LGSSSSTTAMLNAHPKKSPTSCRWPFWLESPYCWPQVTQNIL
jgi:hypothetical protein